MVSGAGPVTTPSDSLELRYLVNQKEVVAKQGDQLVTSQVNKQISLYYKSTQKFIIKLPFCQQFNQNNEQVLFEKEGDHIIAKLPD